MYSVSKNKENSFIIFKEISFDTDSLDFYEAEFKRFQEEKIIEESYEFSDTSWRLVTDISFCKIDFDIDKSFEFNDKKRKFNFSYNELLLALKFFTLTCMKRYDIITVYMIQKSIKWHLLETSYFDMNFIGDFRNKYHKNHNKQGVGRSQFHVSEIVFDFVDYFGRLQIDFSYFEEIYNIRDSLIEEDQRLLPSFESLFKFQEIMDEFIKYADVNTKEKYFPIILWWKITSQIPLRVTEFTIIPYNCIRKDNGEIKLTIKRSSLKGRSSDGLVQHFIEGKYTEQEVVVNQEIWDLVNEYKALVDKYDFVEEFGQIEQRRFLISYKSCYNFFKNKKNPSNSVIPNYFNQRMLNRLISQFYVECVSKEYEITEKRYTDEKDYVEPHYIEKIQCMDTRHFAIMNLVLSDINPVTVKIMAGHKSITTTYGYYKCDDKFITNYTLYLAKKYPTNDGSKFKKTDLMEINNFRSQSEKRNIYFRMQIKSGHVKAEKTENGWCIHSAEESPLPCRKYGFECEAGGCNMYIPEETSAIEKAMITNKSEIAHSQEIIKNLIKERRKIKEFETKLRTEVTKIRSCVEQNANIIREYVIKTY